MEEEVRQTLRAALQEPAEQTPDLGARIRARVAALGDVQVPIEVREAVRPPPFPGQAQPLPSRGKRKAGPPRR